MDGLVFSTRRDRCSADVVIQRMLRRLRSAGCVTFDRQVLELPDYY